MIKLHVNGLTKFNRAAHLIHCACHPGVLSSNETRSLPVVTQIWTQNWAPSSLETVHLSRKLRQRIRPRQAHAEYWFGLIRLDRHMSIKICLCDVIFAPLQLQFGWNYEPPVERSSKRAAHWCGASAKLSNRRELLIVVIEFGRTLVLFSGSRTKGGINERNRETVGQARKKGAKS